jgi:hypothetical protein
MSRDITQQIAELIASEFGGELSADRIIEIYDLGELTAFTIDDESLVVTVTDGEIVIEVVPTEQLRRYTNAPLRDGALAINTGRELRIRTFPLSKTPDIIEAAQ